MDIAKSINENETIFALSGWLDTAAAGDLETELEGIDDNTQMLVFDLKDLEYISSSGVRQVVAAHKKMGGRFIVRNTPENVMSVFKSIGIDKKIDFR